VHFEVVVATDQESCTKHCAQHMQFFAIRKRVNSETSVWTGETR
jgi:hypothetical protein